MLKLIRHPFGSLEIINVVHKGVMVPAKWTYITALVDLQKQGGMHLSNKLRRAHLDYERKKRNVPLVAQVISKSVSDALFCCKNSLGHADFQNCKSTAFLLAIFNDLFDI